MNLGPLLISVVIASAVILGFYTYYNEVNIVYKPDMLPNQTANFSSFNSTFTRVNSLMMDISNKSTDITSKGVFNPATYADSVMVFLDIGKLILQTPLILNDFVRGATEPMLGKDSAAVPWFSPMITTIIMIVVISLIASIVLKRPGSEI